MNVNAGITIVDTKEYLELLAMKDGLEARKAEIEENADKVIFQQDGFFGDYKTSRFVGRDEAMRLLQDETDGLRKLSKTLQFTITDLSIEVQKNDPAKISRTFSARIRFLFTGNLTKVGV